MFSRFPNKGKKEHRDYVRIPSDRHLSSPPPFVSEARSLYHECANRDPGQYMLNRPDIKKGDALVTPDPGCHVAHFCWFVSVDHGGVRLCEIVGNSCFLSVNRLAAD